MQNPGRGNFFSRTFRLLTLISIIIQAQSDRCSTDADCGTLAKPICLDNSCSPCQSDANCTRIDPTAICNTTASPAKCVPTCQYGVCTNPNYMKCDLDTNLCKKCTSHADCDPDDYWGCYSGVCAECTSDAHCSGNPKGKYCIGYRCKKCNPSNNKHCSTSTPRCIGDEYGGGKCVGCISNADCKALSSTYTYCAEDGKCIRPPCTTDSDCSSIPDRKACHPTNFYCVGCTNDSYCSGSTPLCNLDTMTCVECKVDSDCPTNWNCTSSFTCKPPCSSDDDCTNMTAARCDPTIAGGTCVPCNSTSQCTKFKYGTITGVCNSGTCQICTTHADCYMRNASRCVESRSCAACTGDSHCAHHAQYPHCYDGKCSQCATHAHCTSPILKKCSSGTCVECLTSPDCHIDAPRCNRTAKTCGPCLKDQDCSYWNVGRDYCNRNTGVCKACVSNGHCMNPAQSKCNSDGVCVGCNSDQDCSHIPGKNRCDPVSHECKPCVNNAQCLMQTASKCIPGTGCVPCTNDLECAQFDKDKFCVDQVCVPLRVVITGTPVYISLSAPTTLAAVVSTTDDYYTYEWFIMTPGVEFVYANEVLTIKAFTESRFSTFPSEITVQVYVTTNFQNSITATVTIPVNLPPRDGLIIAPDPLSILSTAIIQTTGWNDPESDTPFLYSFAYTHGVVQSSLGVNWIQLGPGFISDTSVTYQFPIGQEAHDYKISLIVWAKDTREAIGFVISQIRAPPPSLDELIAALDNYNLEDILQILIDSITAIERGYLKTATLCPNCSGNGVCVSGACVCNSTFTLPDCSVSTSNMSKLIQLKEKSYTVINNFLKTNPTNQTTLKKISTLIGVTEVNIKFTPSATAIKGLNTYKKHLEYLKNMSFITTEVLDETSRAYDRILNHLRDTCDLSSSITEEIVKETPSIIDHLTYELLRYATPDGPQRIIEYSNFALLAQRVKVSSLPNKQFSINSSTPLMVFPPNGISLGNEVSVVDIQYFYFHPNITQCFGGNKMSYGIGVKKTGTTLDQSYTNSQAFTVKVPVKSGEDFQCADGCEKETVDREGGAIYASCTCKNLDVFKPSVVASFLANSNLAKLANAEILLTYDFIGSPVVWMIVVIWIITFYLGKWAYQKDKNDKLSKGAYNADANNSKKVLLYLQFAHALLGIFYITHRRFSRFARVIIFHFQLMGYLAISAVFRQSVNPDTNVVNKILLMLVPIITLTPVLSTLKWLFTIPPKKNYDPSWARKKQMIAIFIAIAGDAVFVYIILVISANNESKGERVINEWVYSFFITFALENGIIQPMKISIQVCMLGIFQNSKNMFWRKNGPKLISLDIQRVAYTLTKFKKISYEKTLADLRIQDKTAAEVVLTRDNGSLATIDEVKDA